ncbi:MAG: hypothetical protein US42_C0015G0019 [Candidatus Magasanikbacteria bacterium GW2011_GWC2_37_14]|uniref:LysM domain-containing protein n=1 Tax=Candidatus Magasanikbacteria bacterium GW2011_GWC2_37_14 TaxID=1619046 RepID=A0A0G0JFZ4_9BACT|nr:MAG: hypothetical protein US42_C0015G0019 [Candidatus Magasanikbacteria bacterium GW2011_GWC2_37_14]
MSLARKLDTYPGIEEPRKLNRREKKREKKARLLSELEDSLQATKPKIEVLDQALLAHQQRLEAEAITKMHEADEAKIKATRERILSNQLFTESEIKAESKLPKQRTGGFWGWIAAGIGIAAGAQAIKHQENKITTPPEQPPHIQMQPALAENPDLQAANARNKAFHDTMRKVNEPVKETLAETPNSVESESEEENQVPYKVKKGDGLWKILKAKFPAENTNGINQDALNKYWTAKNKALSLQDGQYLFFLDSGEIDVQNSAKNDETAVASTGRGQKEAPEIKIPARGSSRHPESTATPSIDGGHEIKFNFGKGPQIKPFERAESQIGIVNDTAPRADTEQTPVIIKMLKEADTRAEARGLDLEQITEQLANNTLSAEEAGQLRSRIYDVINYAGNKAKKELGILTEKGWPKEYKERLKERPIGQLYEKLGNFVDSTIRQGGDVAEK